MKKNFLFVTAAVILAGLLCLFAGCTETSDPSVPGTPAPEPTPQIHGTESPVKSVVDANDMFAFEIYRNLASENSEDDNLFLSPFSISSAFALVYEGARGETAEQIGSVFYFPENIETLRNEYLGVNNGINSGDPDYELSVANALWAEKTYPFLEDYTGIAKTYYSAETTNLDFINQPEESRITINEWVEDKTNDRIKDLIPGGMIDPLTRLVVTNAIYFKGTWALQFDEELTDEADFKTPSGEMVIVDMMQRTDKDAVYGYTENDDLQVLKIPYESETGKKISMIVLLPKGDDIRSLEENLDPVTIEDLESSIESQRVEVYFPKFKLETEYYLTDSLKSMGITDAFSYDTADFSGMDGEDSELYITGVIHKAFVDVNEKGTEAAAATAIMAGSGSSPPSAVPVFRANHPFIFMIQDDETGNILFIGRISNPAE